MNPNIERPFIDGEKIPDARLPQIFQRPPSMPSVFLRSTLVVGARGAGKTTLFRHLKREHEEQQAGLALHLSLVGELGSIAKKTHSGPLELELNSAIRGQVASKAISLVALALADRFLQKSIPVSHEALMRCLPRATRGRRVDVTRDYVYELRESLAGASPVQFDGLADAWPLGPFLDELAESAEAAGHPLLLLLDRAELVSSAALDPILRLLDQPGSYVALVAIRPGIIGFGSSQLGGSAVAGDHYDVLHLGESPYGEAWQSFLDEAVGAQLGGVLPSLDGDSRELLRVLARDSVRTALELAASCRGRRAPSWATRSATRRIGCRAINLQ